MSENSTALSSTLNTAVTANDRMDRELEKIVQSGGEMKASIEEMKAVNQQVLSVIGMINGLAEQTKVLALNATIQAVKAGQHGASFAVVAKEVGNLAERSAKAAAQTTKLIQQIKQETEKVTFISSKVNDELKDVQVAQQEMASSLHALSNNSASWQEEGRPLQGEPALLQFDPIKMSTGVQSIDDQHKQLIEMVNQMDAACREGRGKKEMARLLDFLADYVVKHFAHEEDVMARHQCPQADKNKEAHQQLLENYTAWRQKYEEGGASLSMVAELRDFLKKWLVGHICSVDTCLKKCVEEV